MLERYTLILSLLTVYPEVTTACALLARSTASATFVGLYGFAGELFPTSLRSAAVGVAAGTGHLVSLVAPFICGPAVVSSTHSVDHCWDYCPGGLSLGRVPENSFEDRAPGRWKLRVSDLQMGCRDLTTCQGSYSSSSNGRRSTCPIISFREILRAQFNSWDINISSGKGLTPNRRQVINLTVDDSVQYMRQLALTSKKILLHEIHAFFIAIR